MSGYAITVHGWLVGPAQADAPSAVPVEPPAVQAQSPQAGLPWPRWCRYEWRVEPYAAVPAAAVPRDVSRAQAAIALSRAGIDEADIDALIDALPAGQAKTEARIWWRNSARIERAHPVVAQLAPLLGLDDQAVDALFIVAAAISS